MASSPDYSGQNQAAVMGARTAQQYYDWTRSEYDRQRPEMDTARQTALRGQVNAQDFTDNVVRPGQLRLIQDAEGFDTSSARAGAANAAQADVQSQFTTARQGTLAALARRGVSSSAAGDMLGSQDVALAAARAGAGAQASRAIQDQGFARRASSLNLAGGGGYAGAGGTTGANPAAGMVGQAASGMNSANGTMLSSLSNTNAAAQQNANSTNSAIAGIATTALVAY